MPIASIRELCYSLKPMNETVLFLHGPMVRDTRLFLSGLSAYAARQRWNVQQVVPPDKAGASFLRKLIDFWHPLGVVETCGHDEQLPIFERAPSVPYVLLDFDLAGQGLKFPPKAPLGFVNCDSQSIVEVAAKFLLKRNFASYAYVSAYRRYHWSETRQRIFRNLDELNGKQVLTFDGTGMDASSGQRMIQFANWLKALPKPCGLLAGNDRTAAIVLAAAAKASVRIPEEVNVIGIDDDESLCEAISPPLTSVRMDFRLGGQLAGESLKRLISKRTRRPLQAFYAATGITNRLSTRQIALYSPSVTKALEAIRRRAADGISSADILPILGGSRRAAEKKFRKAVGKSILEEIIDVRFEKLLPLLADEHCALGSLAGQSGFSSENILQRAFKARYGMTLSAYRRGNCKTSAVAVTRDA